MSIFEHVSVFISVILGLAVVHLLGGLSLILDRRVSTRVYWVHMLWTVNMLFFTSLVWVGNFALSEVSTFSLWHFFNLILYSMFIYLMSGLLYPVRGGEVTNFHQHFEDNRVRFYAVGLGLVITDALDGLLEQQALGSELNVGQFFTLTVYMILFAIGTRYKSRRFDGFTAIVFFAGLLGFLQSLVMIGLVDA
ncbi:hypothetical protein [Elongatibacter sediminis]|uniref:Uncharacterized protein n=1 Tax=Elongatibacter sediminis TaxID=3119006 RepID=A0AAW9RPI8_9GAMM